MRINDDPIPLNISDDEYDDEGKPMKFQKL